MYELVISPGSGYNGANWLLVLTMPERKGGRGARSILGTFLTEREAEEEREKVVQDIQRTPPLRRPSDVK